MPRGFLSSQRDQLRSDGIAWLPALLWGSGFTSPQSLAKASLSTSAQISAPLVAFLEYFAREGSLLLRGGCGLLPFHVVQPVGIPSLSCNRLELQSCSPIISAAAAWW